MKKLNNNHGEVFIAITLALMIATALLGQTKWNTGYGQAIHVRGANPIPPLYYSVAGIEDKVYFDMPTVQDRASYLAGLVGYEGDDIACSGDGTELYILGD